MSEFAETSTLVSWGVAALWMVLSCSPTYDVDERFVRYEIPPQYNVFEAFGRAVLAWIPWAVTTWFIQEAGWVEWLRPVVFGCLAVGLLGGFAIGRRVEQRWGQ